MPVSRPVPLDLSLQLRTASTDGVPAGILRSGSTWQKATSLRSWKILKTSWQNTVIGFTRLHMAMYGFRVALMNPGVLITTADGYGSLSPAGPGFLMNLGAGARSTMDDGTGDMDSAGIGFLPLSGALPGLAGTGAMTTTAGHLSVTTATRES